MATRSLQITHICSWTWQTKIYGHILLLVTIFIQKVTLLKSNFSFRSAMAHGEMLSPSLIKIPQPSSPEMGIQYGAAFADMQCSCQSKVWNSLANLCKSLTWLYGAYHYSTPEELTIGDVSLWCHSPATFRGSEQPALGRTMHRSLRLNTYSWDAPTTKEAKIIPA